MKPKKKKESGERLILEIILPAALAHEFVDFMRLAYTMGNLSPDSSPRDRVDMALVAVINEALKPSHQHDEPENHRDS